MCLWTKNLRSLLMRLMQYSFQISTLAQTNFFLMNSTNSLPRYLGNPYAFGIFKNFMVKEGLKNSPELSGLSSHLMKPDQVSRDKSWHLTNIEYHVNSLSAIDNNVYIFCLTYIVRRCIYGVSRLAWLLNNQ